jgi:post-segregation antitoxin (ccd killing protein)
MPTTERVTVTLASDLIASIDRVERNRSRFIAEAVANELERRRRDGLLRSVQEPHAETVDLVDVGFADWVADLADDDGLVDASGGTAVRWVEGKGWIKDGR